MSCTESTPLERELAIRMDKLLYQCDSVEAKIEEQEGQQQMRLF